MQTVNCNTCFPLVKIEAVHSEIHSTIVNTLAMWIDDYVAMICFVVCSYTMCYTIIVSWAAAHGSTLEAFTDNHIQSELLCSYYHKYSK